MIFQLLTQRTARRVGVAALAAFCLAALSLSGVTAGAASAEVRLLAPEPVGSGGAQPIDATPLFVEVPGVREFTGQLIVRPVQDTGGIVGIASISEARSRIEPWVIRHYPEVDEYIVAVPAGKTDAGYAAELIATGDYEYAHPDWRVFLTLVPNDTNYSQQWHHPKIKSPQAWDITTGSSTLTVAIVDTGVQSNHPDLSASLVLGARIINGVTDADTFIGQYTGASHSHGTQTAGTAAAIGNNNRGVVGVGWNFKIMPLKVTYTDTAALSDLTSAARWAADRGVRAINISFGGAGASTVSTTGNYTRNRGALCVWASGNENEELDIPDHSSYLVVGATTSTDTRASFSNYGVALDLVAPGQGIYTTTVNNSYTSVSGTSFAAPIVTGAVALISAANPDLSITQVESILLSTCDDLGAPGEDIYFGVGRVNVYNAVLAATGFEPEVLVSVSSSPAPGHWVSVLPMDKDGQGSDYTTFERRYVNPTQVRLEVTPTFNDRPFIEWTMNGVSQGSNVVLVRTVDQNAAFSAVYAVDANIESDPPGAWVSVLPADFQGNGGDYAPFTRYYRDDTQVRLEAATTHDGRDFIGWERNGAPAGTNPVYVFNLSEGDVVTARYAAPIETYILTVESTPVAGAPITITPADNDLLGDGVTPFSRVYDAQTEITAAAPVRVTLDGRLRHFDRWLVDGVPQTIDDTTLNLTIALDTTIAPSYVLVGDTNGDGAIDTADIDAFVTALVDPAFYESQYGESPVRRADINGDGVVDTADIDGFVAILVGG